MHPVAAYLQSLLPALQGENPPDFTEGKMMIVTVLSFNNSSKQLVLKWVRLN